MPLPEEVESRYYASRGFDPDHARQVRSHYLPFVAGRELLVELGAGRGEFLDLARDEVGRAVAVDVDPAMCEQVRGLGLEAIHADVRTFLATTDLRPDAVFLAHLIEHLPVDAAFEMVSAIGAITPPGGRIVVVTPNPACLAMLTNDFWSDPTHVRLYTLELLTFLLEQAGFEVVEAAGNPLDRPGPPPETHPPGPMGPWDLPAVEVAPRAVIEIDDGYRLDTLLDEISRLRRASEALAAGLAAQGRLLVEVREHAERIDEHIASAFDHLYGPNEIYVVGERVGERVEERLGDRP
jgi:hypothetical protein